jgi:murein DD-endopeptidase MepM/ murein hydrolase activator NlpD
LSIFSTNENNGQEEPAPQEKRPVNRGLWMTIATWVLAFLMISLAVFSLYQYFSGRSLLAFAKSFARSDDGGGQLSAMPAFSPTKAYVAVERSTDPDTVLPEGMRDNVTVIEVESGDSLFGIAERYDLEPESILWANTKTLNDDPHLISIGINLNVPPTDGILYEWQEGDKLDHIAGLYHVDVQDILLFPGNDIDMTNPVIEPGTYIMIPGGWRPLQPTPPVGGFVGTYAFGWPAPYPGEVSGNDYYSGHQAIDAKCFEGDGIYAADSGVVIYAGPIGGGYGNLVAIDHQNGYLTLYAHLSSIYVSCGQSVAKGTPVAACGSTGNSTGAHLHFEVRQNGGFVNPWHVLQ